MFKKEGDRVIETAIIPYSAGYFSSSNNSPELLFRRCYNNIISNEDFNVDINNGFKVSKLSSLETKFHKIRSNDVLYDDGLMWYDYLDGRCFVQLKVCKQYWIEQKWSVIQAHRFVYTLISLAVCTILYIIVLKILKHKTMKRNFNLEISFNKSSKEIDNSTAEINDLLTKLNPTNFMLPYDPDKVKIANDLYSALLNAHENETIVNMIKEKASTELGIK